MSAPMTRRLRLAEIAATPWKNGGGVTREIATGALPGGGPGGGPDGEAGWGWRISVAEVAQDGPFSAFPDTDRVIAVIEGPGMDLLRPDGTTLALEPFQPVAFAGEDPLEGRLRGGPLRDLNVMARRGAFAATMEFREGPCTLEVAGGDGGCLAVLSLAGNCSLQAGAAEVHSLPPAEVLLHEGSGRFDLALAEGGRAAVIRITRL